MGFIGVIERVFILKDWWLSFDNEIVRNSFKLFYFSFILFFKVEYYDILKKFGIIVFIFIFIKIYYIYRIFFLFFF